GLPIAASAVRAPASSAQRCSLDLRWEAIGGSVDAPAGSVDAPAGSADASGGSADAPVEERRNAPPDLQWSGKRDSNPRPPAWKAGALPLSYSRPNEEPRAPVSSAEPRAPFSSSELSSLEPRVPLAVASFSAHPRSNPASRHPLQMVGRGGF